MTDAYNIDPYTANPYGSAAEAGFADASPDVAFSDDEGYGAPAADHHHDTGYETVYAEAATPEWAATERLPAGYQAPQVTALLHQLRSMIDAARPVPLSASSMINKDEVLDLIDQVSRSLPDELRSANWLLKERDEFLAQVQSEGDALLNQARSQAEQMVQRTEVVRAADQRARQIVAHAEASSRQMRRQAEDYCDQKLASFEAALERTMAVVAAGRSKLRTNAMDALQAADMPPPIRDGQPPAPVQFNDQVPEDRFFDQDVS